MNSLNEFLRWRELRDRLYAAIEDRCRTPFIAGIEGIEGVEMGGWRMGAVMGAYRTDLRADQMRDDSATAESAAHAEPSEAWELSI